MSLRDNEEKPRATEASAYPRLREEAYEGLRVWLDNASLKDRQSPSPGLPAAQVNEKESFIEFKSG